MRPILPNMFFHARARHKCAQTWNVGEEILHETGKNPHQKHAQRFQNTLRGDATCFCGALRSVVAAPWSRWSNAERLARGIIDACRRLLALIVYAPVQHAGWERRFLYQYDAW